MITTLKATFFLALLLAPVVIFVLFGVEYGGLGYWLAAGFFVWASSMVGSALRGWL